MRLIIVGNAPVPWDGKYNRFSDGYKIAKFIDQSDMVIRFKRMNNQYKWWTGRKTDVLYTRSNGATAGRDVRRHPYHLGVEKPKQIFTNFDNFEYPRPDGDSDAKINIDFTKEMIKRNKWRENSVEALSQDLVTQTREILFSKAGKYMPATAGFIAFMHVLNDERFKFFEKYYVGFTFKGWQGHGWEIEKSFVEQWTVEGKLTPLRDVILGAA